MNIKPGILTVIVGISLLTAALGACPMLFAAENTPPSESMIDKSKTQNTENPPAETTPSSQQKSQPVEDSSATKTTAPTEALQPAVTPAEKLIPADRSKPAGLDAAVKLYSQRKFALAATQFEKIIQTGTADVNTHAYLAYCLYNMRQYRAASKQYDWVSKYATKSISLQMSAQRSSSTLRLRMAGQCPGSCLKASDPRWQNDAKGRWIRFSTKGGWSAVSTAHIGQVFVVEHGELVGKGTCPICGGSGTVAVLHDGDPVP